MREARHFRHVVPLSVVVLLCYAHIAAVRASTFHLAAPRHQQSPHSTAHQQQHHQHHHQHHQHHNHNGGGRHRSTGVAGRSPILSQMLGRNQTVVASDSVVDGGGSGGGTLFASASAHASISTPANDTRKPLKLTLITASSSSSSISHSSHNNGGVAGHQTESINHRRWHTSGDTPHRIDRNNDQWAPAQGTPTFRSLQHTGSRTPTGRHVCVDNNPASPPLAVHNSVFSDRWPNDGFFGYGAPTTRQIVHKCCPGWSQVSRTSHGCNKPVCTAPCQNGGKCIRPDVCSCAAGFSGRQCEMDRNECAERKPCDQFCHNTPGSFYCTCRAGFTLHTDRESCRRNADDRTLSVGAGGSGVGRRDDAFEARDMENDVTVDYGGRVVRIEETLAAERRLNAELSQKMQSMITTVVSLKERVEHMEKNQHDLNRMRDQLNAQEAQTRQLGYIVDQLMYKCRNKNSIFCTLP